MGSLLVDMLAFAKSMGSDTKKSEDALNGIDWDMKTDCAGAAPAAPAKKDDKKPAAPAKKDDKNPAPPAKKDDKKPATPAKKDDKKTNDASSGFLPALPVKAAKKDAKKPAAKKVAKKPAAAAKKED